MIQTLHHPVRSTPVGLNRPHRRRWVATPALAAAAMLVLAGCGSTTSGSAEPAIIAAAAAQQFVPTPGIPFPCNLFGPDDLAVFIDSPTLTDVLRESKTPFAYGCVWMSGDETEQVSFSKGDTGRISDGDLKYGTVVEDLGDGAAYSDQEVEIDDETMGIERRLTSVTGDRALNLTVRAVDPSLEEMVSLLRVVQARLAAAESPVDANGEPQLGVDLPICQDVIAAWDRNYSVLAGTASVVSSVANYTSGLAEYAAERGPALTNADLKAAYAQLAAAAADPADPTVGDVEAVRLAVVEIGRVCAAGGVEVDWLPN